MRPPRTIISWLVSIIFITTRTICTLWNFLKRQNFSFFKHFRKTVIFWISELTGYSGSLLRIKEYTDVLFILVQYHFIQRNLISGLYQGRDCKGCVLKFLLTMRCQAPGDNTARSALISITATVQLHSEEFQEYECQKTTDACILKNRMLVPFALFKAEQVLKSLLMTMTMNCILKFG